MYTTMDVKTVFKFLFSVFLSISFLLGLDRIINKMEENRCAMTFMFEYPQYIKINVGEEALPLYPQYNLYVYGEGEEAAKYYNHKFSGIPVLFIPGNAGSYKQVRSVASVAHMKSLDSRKQFHFDFFTVDFNEELSALYGGVLQRQVSFVQLCIRKILQIYKKKTQSQNSVVLIAHSMGGMVAKSIFLDNDFDSSQVKALITLATPHKHPVLYLDRNIVAFYQKVNQFWLKPSTKTANVAVASIGGSNRDIQVRSGLVDMDKSITTLTTGIAGVWLSVDHLCIVWCKQLVLTVVRSLFDMVDPTTSQLFDKVEQRNEVLSYHFSQRYGGKHFVGSKYPNMVSFDPEGRWTEVILKRFKVSLDEKKNINTYFMIPLVDNAYRDQLLAVASNLNVKYWVFGCIASSWRKSVRYCEQGVNLSDQTTLLPENGDSTKRKMMDINLVHLRERGFTHIIFNIPKNHLKASIELDIHRAADRNLAVHIPLMSYSLFGPSSSVLIPADALTYNITLPDLTRGWQSLVVTAHGANCQAEGNAFVRKIVPWFQESRFFLTNESISLQLDVPKAPIHNELVSASLQFLNLNQCNYQIRIANDWIGTWAQVIRFYSPVLLSFIGAIFLYCFSQQLRALDRKSHVPSTLSCLVQMSLIKFALIPELIALAIGVVDSCYFGWWPFPPSDEFLLRREGLDFPLIYLMFGTVGWMVAVIMTLSFSFLVFIAGSAMHSLLIRFLRARMGISSIIAEVATMGIARVPIIISVALITIGISSCGSLALVLGFIVCIWKMFGYYEDQMESLLTEEENHEADDGFRINTTISLMWICTIITSLPTLAVWSKTPTLAIPGDPTLITSFIWSICGMGILQKSGYNQSRRNFTYQSVANVVLTLSVLLSVYGIFSIYRMQYFLSCAIVFYALKQFL